MGDLDVRTFLAIYGGSAGPWGPAMIALTLIGGGWAAIGLLPLAVWSRTRRLALALSFAILTQAFIVWSLKLVFGRVRPWLALGLPPPFGTPHDGSFPSGHAAGSFCVATFFVFALPELALRSAAPARALSLLALVGATFVALSRVYLGAHFPSDVVAGALIGGLVGARAGVAYKHACGPGGTALPRDPPRARNDAIQTVID